MSGVGIAYSLLSSNANLIAVVPAARIIPGVLPLKTALPAISVTSISGNIHTRHMAMATTGNLWFDRVQVTVEATTYLQQKSILALVRLAMPSTHGTVGSYTCDSISVDSEGPDMFQSDPDIYSGSQDFLIRYVR